MAVGGLSATTVAAPFSSAQSQSNPCGSHCSMAFLGAPYSANYSCHKLPPIVPFLSWLHTTPRSFLQHGRLQLIASASRLVVSAVYFHVPVQFDNSPALTSAAKPAIFSFQHSFTSSCLLSLLLNNQYDGFSVVVHSHKIFTQPMDLFHNLSQWINSPILSRLFHRPDLLTFLQQLFYSNAFDDSNLLHRLATTIAS
jgi:hypothetical protein